MEKIFTSFLMGGLGNQLFQVANCISQSNEKNAKAKFRKNSWTPMQGKNAEFYSNNIFSKLDFVGDIDNLIRVSEKSFSFSELDIPENCNIEFHGYFQSGKYFKNYKNEISHYFSPDSEFVKKITEKYPQIILDNTVSIHIRRGDYLNFPHIHPTIDISYINEAIHQIGKYSFIFVFSDDKEWVLSNLKFDNMIIVEGNEDYEDLWMMSLCKNNIISNSSFSWWASFLNKNPNKKIISPSIWFGPGGQQDYHDVFEDNFIKINTIYKEGNLCYSI
jgi:hypothetical protein